jgi:polyphosphate glucokinase
MTDGPKVLVIDVGGSSVKLLATGQKEPRKFPSGPEMTAEAMVREARKTARDWNYEVVSIGYPGPVIHGRPLRDPHNLGPGWVNFDFQRAFSRPVKIVNDAAMQALGSYKGGRMLFLGLGTGLGSAMIVDGLLEPMELAHLPYKNGKTYEDYVGIRGLERLGRKKWELHVAKVVQQLRDALQADEVVLGGGNVKKLKQLPAGTRLGDNKNAFAGGFRMWEGDSHARARAAS